MRELWGRCPKCHQWFHVEYPDLDTHYLCPRCLVAAYRTEWRTVERRRADGTVA